MKRVAEDGLALLAGASVGVIAMYLLDPESGVERRRAIAARAREKLEAAEEAVAPVITTAAQKVGALGRRFAHTAGEYGSELVDSGRQRLADAGESLADETHGLSDRVSDLGRSIIRRGREFLPPAFAHRRRHEIPLVGGALAGVGLIALGAAAAYLCDYNQGRARRARVVDASTHALTDTGVFFRKAGRRIADQFRSRYHRTTARFRPDEPSDQQLRARVRSQLGHVIRDMSGVEVIAERGYVTICGAIPQTEIDSAINTLMGVRGVRGVNHQLRPQPTGV